MQNPVQKTGCGQSGLSCSRSHGGWVSSCLRTAASKKITFACFDQGAWTRLRVLNRNAGTTRKTTFVGPHWGPKFGPQNGGHINNLLLRRTPFWVQNSGPKMGSKRSGVFGAGALSKDGFRQQVTQWASACLPVPVSFLFGRHADSCRQLDIFTNWGGSSPVFAPIF